MLFGAKICSDIYPQTLSVPRSEQFTDSVARGKLFVSRNKFICPRKISELIFAPIGLIGGFYDYYPPNPF